MRRVCGPPPWLWWAVALYAASVPAAVRWWTAQGQDLLGHGAYSGRIAATGGFRALLALSAVQLMPEAFVVAGALAVLAPPLRRRLVEWRHALREPGAQEPFGQMQQFLDRHAPGVRLRVNPRRAGRLARVYPGGWRTTRIAVFRPLTVLWRRDQAAAEAVLLHELGHHRLGEQHVAGLGSPFVAMVRAWPWLFALCGLLPAGLLIVYGEPSRHAMLAQVVLVVLRVPHYLVVPVAALWTAELAADRYAATVRGRPSLLRALDAIAATVPGGRPGLYHPPVRLRRWCATHGDRLPAQLALMLLMPGAELADTLLGVLGAVVEYRLLGASWGWGWGRALALARRQLADGPQWWALLAVLVVWPLFAPVWPRLRGRPGPGTAMVALRVYAAAALLPVTALAVGLAPWNAASGPARAGSPPAGGPAAAPGGSSPPCPSRSAPSRPTRPRRLPPPDAAAPLPAGVSVAPSHRAFGTVRVVSSEPLLGTPVSRIRPRADQLARAIWVMDGGVLADDRGDPPMRTVAARGDTVRLHGERTLTTEVGATTTWWDADLRLPSGGRAPQLTLVWAATGITHAVVDCRSFDSTATSAARFVLELRLSPG